MFFSTCSAVTAIIQSANPDPIQQVATAPAGTQAAQIDIKSAYRCIPTCYKHLPHLVVSITKSRHEDTEVFINRCHPFGLRSSGRNLGLALDATINILTCILTIWFWAKWVDDIVPIRRRCTDRSYDVDLDNIIKWFEYLGWPLSLKKLRDFAAIVRYISFDWDFDLKVVSLPEDKRIKFLGHVTSWIQDASHQGVTIEQTEQLLGTLSHISNHQQNPWVLLSPPETSGALGALRALRRTSAPPGTRDVNMFPLEGSGESRRALESPRGSSRRTLESSGESRSN